MKSYFYLNPKRWKISEANACKSAKDLFPDYKASAGEEADNSNLSASQLVRKYCHPKSFEEWFVKKKEA